MSDGVAEDAPASALAGERYEVGEHLGSGAIGEVYAARDRMLDRSVALKFLHAHLAGDPETVDRFCREARTIAQLSHPNVLQVFDFDIDHDPPFIVLERIEGVTVASLIRTTAPLEAADWRSFARQLLDGLGAAHASGIVHRDIKPSNLLVQSGGVLRIADFGLARTLDAATITSAGTTLGTAGYMSPEQATGASIDHRSDIYAAGCVIFELITGRPPFVADSIVAAVTQHVNEPPPDVRELRPEVDTQIAAVLASMLAKDPGDRPDDARVAARAFDDPLTDLHATASLDQTIRASATALGLSVESAPRDAALYGGFAPREHPNLGRPARRERVEELKGHVRRTVSSWDQRMVELAARTLTVAALVALVAMLVVRGDAPAQNLPVPDFTGRSLDVASIEAETGNWRIETRSLRARADRGTVVRQDPSPGSRAASGSVVRVWVAR